MKPVEKVIWIVVIPFTAALWLWRRLAQQPQPAVSPQKAAPAAAPPSQAGTRRDDLQALNGIGPVYAERLYAAGITSYEELAARPPEELLAIVGASPGLADPNSWIEQARTLQ